MNVCPIAISKTNTVFAAYDL